MKANWESHIQYINSNKKLIKVKDPNKLKLQNVEKEMNIGFHKLKVPILPDVN